ncbi:hypothetical protein WMW72_31440 [Paenibacillus filicis]|uniref:Uncharacterized protein n=1 Tax=Paenibacillus filicis TaxID=669464 RepID=A0ABU9DXE0_9BACL
MGKNKNRTLQQQQQSLADHAEQTNKANTIPTYHKDKHEPNRPSV